MDSRVSRAGFFSARFAGRDVPDSWSPRRNPNWRIVLTGT